MGLFSSKDKNIRVTFRHQKGLPAPFVPQDVVYVTIDKKHGKLLFEGVQKKVSLDLNKITDCRDYVYSYSAEKDKNMFGRALLGGLIADEVGSLIGAASAVGKKKTSEVLPLVVITFLSNGKKKRIFLRRVNGSFDWKEFVAALPKDPNSPYAQKEKQPMEL